MKTLIFGKKSYLSDYLKKSITNSKVYSLSEKNLDLAEFENSNIIINSFYSSLKLEKIDDYELLIKKSIFELSKLLDKIKKKKINIIIYTSSSSIYNSFNENIFKDERNRKVYAALKIAAENCEKAWKAPQRAKALSLFQYAQALKEALHLFQKLDQHGPEPSGQLL